MRFKHFLNGVEATTGCVQRQCLCCLDAVLEISFFGSVTFVGFLNPGSKIAVKPFSSMKAECKPLSFTQH